MLNMADSPYLVALALMDQEGKRAIPLAGRSQKTLAAAGEAPKELGHALSLELLLRIWQRSDDGLLRRAAGVNSLLLVELAMERLPEDLPRIKAAWLSTGETAVFMDSLRQMSERAWSISVAKFQPIALTPCW